MPFDLAFNFRGTAGFVTDQSYAVPALGESYPHLYTNVDGYSINAGFSSGWNPLNRNAANDPRVAGICYVSNDGGGYTFTIDLSSGSAPGAGTYSVDLAFGDNSSPSVEDFQILDNTTVKIDGQNLASISNGHYYDATLTDVLTEQSPWAGTPVNVTFASTTVVIKVALNAIGGLTRLAHFRLTKQEGPTEQVGLTLAGMA